MSDLIPAPVTGEAIDLLAPDDELAALYDRIQDLERECKAVRERIGEELVARMDMAARWTLHAGGFTVTAPSPAPRREYDIDLLEAALARLSEAGEIAGTAAERCFRHETKVSVDLRGVNALLKLGGRVREEIDLCARETVPRRRVKVARS